MEREEMLSAFTNLVSEIPAGSGEEALEEEMEEIERTSRTTSITTTPSTVPWLQSCIFTFTAKKISLSPTCWNSEIFQIFAQK